MTDEKRRARIRGFIILLAGIVLVVVVLAYLSWREKDQVQEQRGQMSDGFGRLETIEWNGATWQRKPAVTTILLAGVDKDGTITKEVAGSYRSGGQADFLMLVVIDQTDKQICRLQIDRDTIADVEVLGVFGNEVGTRKMQICLAHAFGATPTDNAKYTVKAVQSLMGGLTIDGYYMVDYSSVPLVNDALGGVTVELKYDMTAIHPEWTKGSFITLHGMEAEEFVRARKNLGESTNTERMIRQDAYMSSAIAKLKEKLNEDVNFGAELLDTLQDVSVTNFTTSRLLDQLNRAVTFDMRPIDHLAGTYGIGDDGFTEFYLADDAAVRWVFENLYTRLE